MVGNQQRLTLEQRCYECGGRAEIESERLTAVAALSPLHVGVGCTKVDGKHQLTRRWMIRFPAGNYETAMPLASTVRSGLNKVEGTLHTIIFG